MNLQINIFTKKRSSLIEKSLRFHIVSYWFWSKNILSLLAGKYYGKKKSALWLCVWCWSKKYTESFGGKNILHCAVGFLPLKVEYIFVLTQDSVQIRSKFFLSATLHTQNLLKESLYFDLFPGPFKSANFCSIIVR